MIVSCQYFLDNENFSEAVKRVAWFISEHEIPKTKCRIKTDIKYDSFLESLGLEFIDCFLYNVGNDYFFEIIFNLNNFLSKEKIEAVQEFVCWFRGELRLPLRIKILEVKVAEENIPSSVLFGVL